jgi:2-polyprenyl-3-methyl-5-hydroxy-6-metoxy-1,4-benzoquinol methylase
VPSENLATSDYDACSNESALSVAWRERAEAGGDAYGIPPGLLELLGNIGNCTVLDAGCGDGYLARVLAARGAHVTGIDLSPRLIKMARSKNPGGDIDYRVADLSQPLPDDSGRFDAVASYLVLNDVRDYRGIVFLAAGWSYNA